MSTISGNMNTLTINSHTMDKTKTQKDVHKAIMTVRMAAAGAGQATKVETINASGGITKDMYAGLASTVKAVQSKISAEGKTLGNSAFSAESLMKNIPGLTKERAKEISDKLNKQLQDFVGNNNNAKKPKSLREAQEMRFKDMFDTGMLKTAAARIAKAVGSMDAVAHARMGELAKEFQALQKKMVATAHEIVKNGEPKNKAEQAKANENQQKLFDLIGKSENKRTEALKTLSVVFQYGPQEKNAFDNPYGDFGGKNSAFAEKIKSVMNRIKA